MKKNLSASLFFEEPRRKQKRHKQAFKTKWQQKRTFREFDEKFEKELKKEEAMES
jgi:hypothetical protein